MTQMLANYLSQEEVDFENLAVMMALHIDDRPLVGWGVRWPDAAFEITVAKICNDISFTLWMPEGSFIFYDSLEELLRKLHAFRQGKMTIDDFHEERFKQEQERLRRVPRKNDNVLRRLWRKARDLLRRS